MGIAKHAPDVCHLLPSSEELKRIPREAESFIFLSLPSIVQVGLKGCWTPSGWEPGSTSSKGKALAVEDQKMQHKIALSGGPQRPARDLTWNFLQRNQLSAVELTAAAQLGEQHLTVCAARFRAGPLPYIKHQCLWALGEPGSSKDSTAGILSRTHSKLLCSTLHFQCASDVNRHDPLCILVL